MLLSFIIPHKGRQALLIETLESIWQQNYDHEKIEIIIVTQNHEMAVTDLPSANTGQVSLIKADQTKTISGLRNLGVAQSQGQFLAFLDADVKLSTNWIAAMLEQLTGHENRALVSAVQVCDNSAPVLEKIRTALSNAEVDTNVRFLPGRNLLLSRETFDKVGGFPEHLITCEDYYFTDQVYQQGNLFYASNASYVHLGEDKRLDEMFKKEIWRGQSNIQSIKGRTIPLSEWPSFLVPVWIAAFALIGLMALVFLQVNLFAASLVLTLLPIILYTNRLFKLCENRVSYWHVLTFYLVYFPARVIGTFGGVIKSVEIK